MIPIRTLSLSAFALILGSAIVGCSAARGEQEGQTGQAVVDPGHVITGLDLLYCAIPANDGSWTSASAWSGIDLDPASPNSPPARVGAFIARLEAWGCAVPGEYFPSTTETAASKGIWFTTCPAAILSDPDTVPPFGSPWGDFVFTSNLCVPAVPSGYVNIGWNFLAPIVGAPGGGCNNSACDNPPGYVPPPGAGSPPTPPPTIF